MTRRILSNDLPKGERKHVVVIVISAVGVFLFLTVARVLFWMVQRRKKISTETNKEMLKLGSPENEDLERAGFTGSPENEDLERGACGECRMFQLSELKSATINFSEENRLGEGGFGSVYKGTLDGTIIAVKRLEGWSKQGFDEFKNEVELLANLKHKNLVKLVGYCLEKNEKLLCYEYLPGGSLDKILETDKMKRDKLGWQTRYKIIKGISSGLQYLHVESGSDKIVHKDLKPSNILLDEHMNPKISDFGLARLYNDDKSHMETSKCQGTHGYMAPELVMHGTYSNKFDVYSFGVMLLEIVTGRKISSFVNNQLAPNLISYARQHWEKGEVEVVKDPTLDLDDVCLKQLSRCIHLGLLCVEQDPNNRPDMDAINLMLRNDSITVPPLPRLPSRMDFSQSMNKSNGDMPNYEGISAVSLPLEPTRHDVLPSVSSVSA